MNELSVIYYGNVFDASGYGQAARAYIHALDSAGIKLSVVDLNRSERQVRDALVESLVRRMDTADFCIFHGIPPQWARLGFRLPNVIAMTVWETDTMPSQWRNILNHTLEVWLPCEFNVAVFSRALETPVFKLPHPVFPPHTNGNGKGHSPGRKPVPGEDGFIFYSIFEWQERKSPQGLIETFLRAFPDDSGPRLMIKTNPGAADAAHRELEQARGHTRSGAHVEIHAEAWDESQIAALHERGDCYVSLHRGEGWCYPLFEAASRGKPVIATNYSGPLDYLDAQAHRLVQCALAPVQQPYLYYHPGMRWAEPDFAHAAEHMRWVYDHREAARQEAAAAAERIHRTYSLEAVGAMARERLMGLLRRTQPQKWGKLDRAGRIAQLKPAVPIPADWYDEDYFENGLKSNWEEGYSWPLFGDLFQQTAEFLTAVFQEAESFLDMGCAKGFLVRALRERGKACWGFDHSPWAIDRAEACVKPFVMSAGADEASFDRQFDVLTAFSLFESLSEAQALSLLSRARAWTRQAMLAVIFSFENEREAAAYEHSKADGDLSHITMKSREWWHELFLRAGWRQDCLHRVALRMCQEHELPLQMGWKFYLYAPA